MIRCGKNTPIRESSMLPDVSVGISALLQNMKVGVVQKRVINNRTEEVTVWKDVLACRQAMPENLAISKEGERSWRWHTIYASPDLDLETDDLVIIRGIRYRIMDKENWQEYGYLKYSAIEDYRNSEF